MGGGEGNAEFDRSQGQTSLEHEVLSVKRLDFSAPGMIMSTFFELGDHRLDDIVFNPHGIRGDIALTNAVEIAFANVQGIET